METFGPFTIHECLGVGAATMVHRATVQPRIGPRRELVLRRLQPSAIDIPARLDRFIREAHLAAQLDHPNIARVYDVARIRDVPYVALELVRGRTIERLSRALEGISIDLALSLLIELCRAIEYASVMMKSAGVVTRFGHLDTSPYNLVVTLHGHLKVIDAAAIRPDVFSVAAIAWGMLAGRRLFELDDGERCDELEGAIHDALDARNGRGPTIADLRGTFERIGIARTAARHARVAVPLQGRTTAVSIPRARFARGSTTPYAADAAITQRSRLRDSRR